MEQSEDSSPSIQRKKGIVWTSLSVKNFTGTNSYPFPSSGAAYSGEILAIVGDTLGGKTLLCEAITKTTNRNYRVSGYSTNISNIYSFITEINRSFYEELTVVENIELYNLEPEPA